MTKTVTVRTPQPAWGAATAIEDRYGPLVARLEQLAAVQPDDYRRRVLWRAWLGYAFVAAVLATFLIIVAGLVAVVIFGGHDMILLKPAFVVLLMAGAILHALWVKSAPPAGVTVTPGDAPALFGMIEDVRGRLDGPKADAVLISADFNAAIVQWPRLGIFGWYKNYVVLGLPLLMTLSPDEIRAVIAHEYGHLSGGHGKSSAWVYRVRMTWLQLSQSLGSTVTGRFFQGFFKWYGPWFNAYSFVLARVNEYAADAAAVQVAGGAVVARTLVRVAAESARYDRFWQTLWGDLRPDADAVRPLALMGAHFVSPMGEGDVRHFVAQAMAEETDRNDTHPRLADRLKAIHEPAPGLEPIAASGAEALLGASLVGTVAQTLDTEWWKRASSHWQARQSHLRESRDSLDRLDARAAAGTLTEAEGWQYQQLLEQAGRHAEARALAETRFASYPDDADARLAVGRMRLESGDAAGIDLLTPLIDAETPTTPQLAALRIALAHVAADDPRATSWRERLEIVAKWRARVDAALNHVGEHDVFTAAELPAEEVDALRERMKTAPGVRGLWVGRRHLRVDPSIAQYVALYDPNGPVTPAVRDFAQSVLNRLSVHGNALVVDLIPARAWLRMRLQKLDGGRVAGK